MVYADCFSPIAAVGLIAIPFGDTLFIDREIVLELAFVALSALMWKKYNKALYACIPLATLVIVGNSPARPNVNLMTTFSKPLNVIVLVIGGYVLQIALLYTVFRSILNIRSMRLLRLHNLLKIIISIYEEIIPFELDILIMKLCYGF